mgnify:FL=1
MTVIEIENNLSALVANFKSESFIYDLLLAYGTPKSTIKRVQVSDHDKLLSDGELCYNTFPFPNILQKQKDEITELVFGVLDEREKHSQKILAELYDPNKMPEGLQKAYHALDMAIEQCYCPKPFETDEERLEYLFRMYEEMTSKEEKR